MFCRHQWVGVAQAFNPPRLEGPVKIGATEDVAQVLYGVTNIRERCTKCGRTRVVTVAGRVPGLEA
jgi:hypothetical protein